MPDLAYLRAGTSASGTVRDLRKLRLRLARPRPPRGGTSFRVVVHVPEYPPLAQGGAEQSIRAIAVYLAGAGHEVRIVAEAATEGYELDGLDVVPNGSRRDLRQLYEWADVAIGQRQSAVRSQMLAGTHGIPFVLCVRDVGEWTRLPVRPDLTVFNAEFQRDLFDFDASSVVVYPPIKLSDFTTTRGDRVTLVNMNERKGAPLFLEIVRRMPHVQFLGVTGMWGEQVLPSQPLANLEVIEAAADPRDVYGRTRVLLLPSRWESFGRVAVEAGASGIPVVATPNPGTVEVLGDACVYVRRDDVEGWMSAIEGLADPVEYEFWSSRIRHAVERFGGNEQLEQFLHALAAVVRG
jgi:glycosyltransferase involved in cell wall biosynthesis